MDIKLAIKGNRVALLRPVDLIAGTVGLSCTLYCDDIWNAYSKTITYKVGSTILGTQKIKSNTFNIPAKILATAGLPLEIGITGRSVDNSIIIPTSWCLIGTIQNGAVIHNNENNLEDDEIIYEGGDVGTSDNIIYEGGGV